MSIMQTVRKPDVDVLVIGAGPIGLMLANQLRRRGIGRTTASTIAPSARA
jgi:threonine dehydrogenase-like Zn-dependent dehydrogenase